MALFSVVPITNFSGQNQFFTYQSDLPLQSGQLVRVPFGGRKIDAVVWDGSPLAGNYKKIKSISVLLDPQPVLSAALRRLAEKMSDDDLSSLGLVIKTMLPARPKRAKNANSSAFTRSSETPRGIQKPSELWEGLHDKKMVDALLAVCNETIRSGRVVIFLVPEKHEVLEWGEKLLGALGETSVVVWTREAAPTKDYNLWNQIRQLRAGVVVGTRSAVFAPTDRLGAIIMIRESDQSYKQWDQYPKYSARSVAGIRSELENARYILTSAGPSVETKWRALSEKIKTVHFNQVAETVTRRIVDLSGEARGKSGYLSYAAQETLINNYQLGARTVIITNRLGAATIIKCESCQHVINCELCKIPLVLRRSPELKLNCRYCQAKLTLPSSCPRCGKNDLRLYGGGTERVESEVQRLIPRARVARWEAGAIPLDYAAADIIVGTRAAIRAIGSRTRLVILIDPDRALALPDYRSSEWTYSGFCYIYDLLANNGLRGKKELIIQTYMPDHPVIQALGSGRAGLFYQSEIKQRRDVGFPPFSRFLGLKIDPSEQTRLTKILKEKIPNLWIRPLSRPPGALIKITGSLSPGAVLQYLPRNTKVRVDWDPLEFK